MPDEIPEPDFPADRPDESPVEEELTVSDHPGGGAAGLAAGGLVGQGAAHGVMQEAAGEPADAEEAPRAEAEEPGKPS